MRLCWGYLTSWLYEGKKCIFANLLKELEEEMIGSLRYLLVAFGARGAVACTGRVPAFIDKVVERVQESILCHSRGCLQDDVRGSRAETCDGNWYRSKCETETDGRDGVRDALRTPDGDAIQWRRLAVT